MSGSNGTPEIPTLVPAIGEHGMGNGHGHDSGDNAMAAYRKMHAASLADPNQFWLQQAQQYLTWDKLPTIGLGGSFEHGDIHWFADGQLNVCYNAIDRHVQSSSQKADQTAILFEGDEPNDIRAITYRQLQRKVCQIANALTYMGVKPNDVVTIYMPMSTFIILLRLMIVVAKAILLLFSSHEKQTSCPFCQWGFIKMLFFSSIYQTTKNTVPELPMTLLACARIGALHSVVFAGFSADALSQRIAAAHSKVIVTADLGKRGGKTIPIKDIVNAAIAHLPNPHLVQKVLVWERFFDSVVVDKKTTPKSESAGGDDDDDDDMAPIEIETTTNNTDPFSGATSYVMKPGLDVRMNILVQAQRPYSVPVSRNAEDGLFLLYTSGSTGQPKGLLHTTGGYSLFAAFTMHHSFNLQPNTDRFACVADCGWYVPYPCILFLQQQVWIWLFVVAAASVCSLTRTRRPALFLVSSPSGLLPIRQQTPDQTPPTQQDHRPHVRGVRTLVERWYYFCF